LRVLRRRCRIDVAFAHQQERSDLGNDQACRAAALVSWQGEDRYAAIIDAMEEAEKTAPRALTKPSFFSSAAISRNDLSGLRDVTA
jgi:hypothetical protein